RAERGVDRYVVIETRSRADRRGASDSRARRRKSSASRFDGSRDRRGAPRAIPRPGLGDRSDVADGHRLDAPRRRPRAMCGRPIAATLTDWADEVARGDDAPLRAELDAARDLRAQLDRVREDSSAK